MTLIKYKDTYDKDYSWFWVHDFDGVEKVVSEVFNSKEDAEQWAKQLKDKYEQNFN